MKGMQTRVWMGIAGLALTAGMILRLHNGYVWNPYWGYDGGGHLRYLEILRDAGRLPTLADTYVAWHEPLFYILAIPFRSHFSLFPAVISVITLFLLCYFSWCQTKKWTSVALTAILLLSLPVAITASTFFSNEGLVHLLLIAALFFAVQEKYVDTKKRAVVVGLLLGIALLTKITAFLGLIALLCWHGWRAVASKSTKPLVTACITCIIAILLASPWLVYRTKTFHGLFTNPFEAERTAGILPEKFFRHLDPSIFSSPFWKAGSGSFWTMSFALTVTDYDAILHHLDKSNEAAGALLAVANRTVTPLHARLSRAALLLAMSLAPLFLYSFFIFVKDVWRERKQPKEKSLFLIFIVGSVAALCLNVLKSGALERGVLKTLFILSAVFLSILVTTDVVTRETSDERMSTILTVYTFVIGSLFAIVGFALTWV